MLVTDDTGVEDTGLGVERVDGGVDTQLRDTTGQDGGGVQMGEGGGRGRVSQIVSRDVDGLDGGNGTLGGGGDTLLHDTHVDGESGLVTDSGGDTTEKSGHLRTGLGETENVVNCLLLESAAKSPKRPPKSREQVELTEKQDILSLLVTEVLKTVSLMLIEKVLGGGRWWWLLGKRNLNASKRVFQEIQH